MARHSVLVILAILLMLPFAAPAQAHAALVRSEPQAGSSLDAAPEEVVLEFTEELDPEWSQVRLYDSATELVRDGPGIIDPAQPLVLRLQLGDIPNGSYTAVWRVRSTVDGHVTEGNIPFGIGVAVSTAGLIPPPGTPEPATLTPPPLSSALRWLSLLLTASMLGVFPFGLLVWRPAVRANAAQTGPAASIDSGFARGSSRIVAVAGGLLALASVLFLIDQASVAAGVPFFSAIGAPALQLLAGRFGQLVLARIALTVVIVGLAWRLPPLGQGANWRWWLPLALGAALLLTFSLNAHGAAEQQNAPLAVTMDWLHLVATVVWIGGLAPLALAIGGSRRGAAGAIPLGALVPRFSAIAVACVAVLAGTGIYSYLLHVGQLELLPATTYGRALGVKLGLFAVLVLLGAINLLIFSPRLRSSGNRVARGLVRNVRIELVLGALVLLAVGAMTSVAPSKVAWSEQEKLGQSQTVNVNNVDVRVQVAPAQIGDNEFAVDVADDRPGAAEQPSKVLLRFHMQGMEMGEIETEAVPVGDQRYAARGNFMSMGGRWDVEVIVRRAGFEDVRHTFTMDIVKSAF